MTDQLTAIVTIDAKDEHRGEVKRLLIELADKTRNETGNICYVLHVVPDDPNRIIIYEQWQNQAALDSHMNQDYLKQFLEACPHLLSGEVAEIECRQIN